MSLFGGVDIRMQIIRIGASSTVKGLVSGRWLPRCAGFDHANLAVVLWPCTVTV